MTTIISGTNRPNSYTHKLSLIYKEVFEEYQHAATVYSLCSLPENLLISDLYGKRSAGFSTVQQMIVDTDKFLFILPEYNGSFPGVAKLFIDCLDFPGSFKNKKAALVGLSSGKYGNIRGIDHFTGVAHYLGIHLLPLKLHIPSVREEIHADGKLLKPDTTKFIHEQVEQFIAF